ncbi:hypothetical protein BOTBODRAFT_143690, partial [Botryobasidium botryosum FD-172 SS1]
MESWPADSRFPSSLLQSQSQPHQDAPQRKNAAPVRWDFPVLEPGSLGSATLIHQNGPDHDGTTTSGFTGVNGTRGAGILSWEFIAGDNKRLNLNLVGNPVKVFPETSPAADEPVKTTALQRAEQGVQFLRTYHPDVDIPFELVQTELARDYDATKKAYFDPYEGDRLATAVCSRVRGVQPKAMMAFPMGEVGQHLNVSMFHYTQKKQDVFAPTVESVMSFGTAIQQIASSSGVSASALASNNTPAGPVLAVRTHGSVHFVAVQTPGASAIVSGSAPTAHATKLLALDVAELGGRPMDVVFSPYALLAHPTALVVTGKGCVWNIDVGQEKNGASCVVEDASDVPHDEEMPFWRVCWGKDENAALLASDRCVKLLDLRSPQGTSQSAFALTSSDGVVTSIEGSSVNPHLMCLSTTDRLLWADDRMPEKPVLAWRHGREFDRTLQAKTTNLGRAPITFLTSRKNNLITLYDVSASPETGLTGSYSNPALFCLGTPTSASITSRAFFRHPLNETSSFFNLFSLTSRGAVYRHRIGYADSDARDGWREGWEWDEGVRALNRENREQEVGVVDGLAARDCTVMNLRREYEEIFDIGAGGGGGVDQEAINETAAETLDHMQTYLQAGDHPTEHMLTSFDIAFRAGDEPKQQSRSDFLTGSTLSSLRGYHAVKSKELPIVDMVKDAMWHFNVTPTLRIVAPGVFDSGDEDGNGDGAPGMPGAEALAKLSAVRAEPPTKGIEERERRACRMLAVDLALSTDVFSAIPFASESTNRTGNRIGGVGVGGGGDVTPDEVDALSLSLATQALSIGGSEPPGVAYGYLRPNRGTREAEASTIDPTLEDDDTTPMEPLGVRLLLQEWTVGEDPELYAYEDPYHLTQDEAPKNAASRTALGMAEPVGISQRSRQAPPVVASASTRFPPPPTQTQPPPVLATRSISSTQVQARPLAQSFPASQGNDDFSGWAGGSSQGVENYPSTQPLPGRFGGRPPPEGKKKQKKRMVVYRGLSTDASCNLSESADISLSLIWLHLRSHRHVREGPNFDFQIPDRYQLVLWPPAENLALVCFYSEFPKTQPNTTQARP